MEKKLKEDINKTIKLYQVKGIFTIFNEDWINSEIIKISPFSSISISKTLILKELNILFAKPIKKDYIKKIIKNTLINQNRSFRIINIDIKNIDSCITEILNVLIDIFVNYSLDVFLYFYNIFELLSVCKVKNNRNIEVEIYLTKDNLFSFKQEDETKFIWDLISNLIALFGNYKIEIHPFNNLRVNNVMSILLKNILNEVKDKLIIKIVNYDEIIIDKDFKKITKFYEDIDNQLDKLLNM